MITYYIAVVTVVQLALFSGFILSSEKRLRKPLRLLAAFLVTNALFIIAFLLRAAARYLHFEIIPYGYFLSSSGFLFGPMLYFYSSALADRKILLNSQRWLHFLPFFSINIIYLFSYTFSGKWERTLPYLGHVYLVGFMHIQILTYMLITLAELTKFRKVITENLSSIEKVDLNWLGLTVTAFLCMWIVDIMQFLFGVTGLLSEPISGFMTFLSISVNFVFANLLIFKGLRTPEILIQTSDINVKSKTLLDKNQMAEIAGKLKNHMNKAKPYLEPEITLQQLAAQIDVDPRYVSHVINESFVQNFYEFINYYRIEEAKQMLVSSIGKDRTVLEILYECGFNSKSVFNSFFKKSTGITPSQFRKLYSAAG